MARAGLAMGMAMVASAAPALGQGLPGQYGGAPPPPAHAPYGTTVQPRPPSHGTAYAWQRPEPEWRKLRMLPPKQAYEGGEVPEGYHLEERIDRGPFVTGIVLAVVPYVLGGAAAAAEEFPNASGFLVVPLAGPWLTLTARDVEQSCLTNETGTACFDESQDDSTVAALVLDGVLQATGATLIAAGVLMKKTWLVRNGAAPSWRLAPVRIGTAGYGVEWSRRW